jgi:hypothetical protein
MLIEVIPNTILDKTKIVLVARIKAIEPMDIQKLDLIIGRKIPLFYINPID